MRRAVCKTRRHSYTAIIFHVCCIVKDPNPTTTRGKQTIFTKKRVVVVWVAYYLLYEGGNNNVLRYIYCDRSSPSCDDLEAIISVDLIISTETDVVRSCSNGTDFRHSGTKTCRPRLAGRILTSKMFQFSQTDAHRVSPGGYLLNWCAAKCRT